jgi:hypothetical protein
MIPFLKQVADHYYNIGEADKCCFIFPNRRSLVFFTRHLCQAVKDSDVLSRPIVAPEMLTINDFFHKVGGMHSVERVRLLIELYDCYRECNPKAESLDEFIFWGDVILSDFNDVDKYLVDPKQLFANISDLKKIQDTYTYLTDTQRKAIEAFVSHFSDLSGRLTVNLDSDEPDVKGKFLMIWNILHDLYELFNKRLMDRGMAYEGMVYRQLAQRLKNESVEDVFNDVWQGDVKFVFVGLNALNECEKMLLRKLRDAGRAEFCWDYSGKIISDPKNRSSFFMAENVVEFPQAAVWDREGLNVPEINVVSVPSSTGQAKRLPDVLNGIGSRTVAGLTDCAIVLPDETLLSSVLNSIPDEVEDINVTMGLPMTGSILYSMMSDIAAIQLHTVNRKGKWYFYHKQVWDLFANDLFRKASDEKTLEIISKVKSDAAYYISQDVLSGTPLLDAVFRPVIADQKLQSASQIKDFAEYQKQVLTAVISSVTEDVGMNLELEYAKEYYKCVNVLKGIDLEVLPVTYVRLLNQLLSAVSVPFRGEPLKGLQIMGPLETRALDFRNLVILSANEGVFPRRNVSSSFVPPELRKGFGLPTYEYQDAVWAYYFYRMISRAEKVWMFTDTRTEGLKSGEESRYIKQLEYHFNIPLNRYVVRFDKMKTAKVEDIVKTLDDVRKIKETVLSATTVQNYLACPAKFYYGTVKELKAEEEVAESLDYGMFGTVYHETMRSLYASDRMTAKDIQSWLGREDEIKSKIKELIIDELNLMEVSGRNLVVTDVILKYVMKTLQRDLELLEKEGVDFFEILGREVKVSGEFKGQKFKGFIDRLDSFHPGQVRVVDYKTGKVLDDDEKINDDNALAIAEDIFAEDIKERPKIALQFFIYDMLVQNHPLARGKQLFNCVYSTARLFKEPPLNVPRNEMFFNAVSERLENTLKEMYSLEVPFRRTNDEKVCEYCDFKMICGR